MPKVTVQLFRARPGALIPGPIFGPFDYVQTITGTVYGMDTTGEDQAKHIRTPVADHRDLGILDGQGQRWTHYEIHPWNDEDAETLS